MTARHQLHTVTIGDELSSWIEAGFRAADGGIAIGSTVLTLVGPGDGRGIQSIGVEGLESRIDGMLFDGAPPSAREDSDNSTHPNHVHALDHLVVMSPDMDRSTTALTNAGLEHRRTRTFGPAAKRRRQSFFWLGDIILEVVGLDDAHDEGPAQLWGLALTTSDLDDACDQLGSAMGAPRDAVQDGRRIATMKTRELGISVAIALMTPHPRSLDA